MDDRYAELPEDIRNAYLRVETMLEHGSMDEVMAALMSLPKEMIEHAQTKRLIAMVRERWDNDSWFALARKKMQAHVGDVCRMSPTGHAILFATPQCGLIELSSERSIAEIQMRAAGIEE